MSFSPFRVPIAIFFFVWLTAGLAINSANLRAFRLQQLVAQALVENGHSYIEPSTPSELSGDTFIFRGRMYAAKQPGESLAGALAYAPLASLGITYGRNYLLASALVTFFSTSLMLAISAAAVFHLARALVSPGASILWPFTIAMIYSTSTTVAAYSGVLHHDVLAGGFLTVAAALTYALWTGTPREIPAALGAGLFLGLTITMSMLPAPLAALIGVFVLAIRRWRVVILAFAGALAGVAPLLISNAARFGNPFLVAYVAGNFADTYPRFDLANTAQRLLFYASLTVAYMPVLGMGVVGLFCFPARLHLERLVLAGLLAANVLTVANIDVFGGCQYGPRYLIPSTAFACVGIAGYSYASGRKQIALLSVTAPVAAASFAINAAGALEGVMNCDLAHYAAARYWSAMLRGELPSYPLAAYLALPWLASAALLAALMRRAIRTAKSRIPAS